MSEPANPVPPAPPSCGPPAARPSPPDPGAPGEPLDRVRIVLVETTHTGNLGAAARAMKTMGLARLVLVNPRHRPDAEALAMASGADDLLARAEILPDLPAALAGCRLAVGTSARRRSLPWPVLTPPEAARHLLAEAALGEVALVFGRESSGLTNEELARCGYLVQIPTDPAFASLNLAAAVQVLAYEVRRAWLAARAAATAGGGAPRPAAGAGEADREPGEAARDLATADELEGFHAHLAQALSDLGFADPEQSARLRLRLRRLFHRARPDRVELNILRGILSAAQGRKGPGRFARRTPVPRDTGPSGTDSAETERRGSDSSGPHPPSTAASPPGPPGHDQ